jgi:hypothetical protein
MTMKDALIAASVAGLFATAAAPTASAADKADDQVMCEGINACKGKGACAHAGNACAGQNACKGKGVVKTSKKECEAKGGKVASAKK